MSKTKEDSEEISHFFFKQYQLNKDKAFSYLKELALHNSIDNVRYNAAKFLYKYYPQESSELIDWILRHDNNYNIPIINEEFDRYNFNDLINCAIERRYNRDDLVDFVKKSNFVNFALSWKEDYIIDNFKIYCVIPLQIFLFQSKSTNYIAYLCYTYSDPFYFLKSLSRISFLDLYHKASSNYIVRALRNIIEKLFKSKSIQIFILNRIDDSDLPHYKITIENYDYVFYLEF